MDRITCPNCGPRRVEEYRYGGEVRARPSEGSEGESTWADYLYIRENPSGPLKEWWYHEKGCGLWFIALRDTSTQEVKWTHLRLAKDEG